MAKIRQHIVGRDRERFVARTNELAYFDDVLAGRTDDQIVHLVGTGGIGKSALLREVRRRAESLGRHVIWIDGRDVPPFPTVIESLLATASSSAAPTLVVIDSYELISALDNHLRDSVIPELPDTTIVVFGTRFRPSRGWYDHGWDSVVHTVELDELRPDDAAAVARAHGVESEGDIADLVKRSHGSPLALVVGAEAGPGGSVASLVERLLGDEVDPSRYRTLGVAALARVTNPELLEAVLDDGDPQESYKWLADRSFSEHLADGVTLHALVAESVIAWLRESDPVGEATLRRRIADHLYRRALAGRFALSMDLQHLVVDPNVRWGFSADIGSRHRLDTIRPGDADRIGTILASVGIEQWWQISRAFLDEHPECAGVAGDGNGTIGGYFVAVTPATAPDIAERDPLLGPWLRHAREQLRTDNAVLWREAVDLTGDMGEVTSLLGAGGLLSTGVPNPRYGYLPISPLLPAARAFSEALGATHHPELDFVDFGLDLECHIVDFGPAGMLGFQRDWIYRETGASPPTVVDPAGAAQLLRLLREPAELAHGPSWLGGSPAERLERLRSLVEASLSVFGEHRDDDLARRIIEAAYLGEDAPHETIARSLHLSRSAYFRRLQAATQRLSQELAVQVRRGG